MTAVPEDLAGLDLGALGEWAQAHVPFCRPPLEAERVSGGHSNLTYLLLDAAGNRWALRRPPLGQVAATAHDVAREYRIMSAHAGSSVPVPAAVAACEDPSVIGAPFFPSGFVDGLVARHAFGCNVHAYYALL